MRLLQHRMTALCLVLAIWAGPATAQENAAVAGKVDIIQDDKISLLTEQYIHLNARTPEIDGYRVQVFFESGSNSKNLANSARDAFLALYPGTRVYVQFRAPYYLVRAGNFRTLNEAVGFRKKIAADYPDAFPVKDKIAFKDI